MSTRSLLALTFLLAACDPHGPEVPDGSLDRDAMVGDSGGLLDGGSSDASVPLPTPDAGLATCDVSVCDPAVEESCPAGACVLWGAEPNCADMMPGTTGPGMPCADTTECGPGLACFEEAGAGVCARVCCPGDAMACAVGSRCGGSGVLVDGTETGWGRCLALRSCDVLRPDACEPREGCYLIEAGTRTQTECRVAGVAGAGELCVEQQECADGFFCGGVGSTTRCVRFCDVAADRCPTEEGRCVAGAHLPDGVGLCTMDATTARMQ